MTFKIKKFKNQLEESRHGDLLKTCADCLVSGLLIMAGCLSYGVYAFSYDKLRQLTKACYPSEVKFWSFFKPMASFNSGLQTISCQVQVYSRITFGVILIGAIGLLLIQRTGVSNPTMPVTFLVLLLGVDISVSYTGKSCAYCISLPMFALPCSSMPLMEPFKFLKGQNAIC